MIPLIIPDYVCRSFGQSLVIIQSLFGFAPSHTALFAKEYFSTDIQLAIVIGILGSLPILPRLQSFSQHWTTGANILNILKPISIFCLLLLSGMALASGTHNPFIYFRF